MNDDRSSNPIQVFFLLGILAIVFLTTFQFTTNWQWSILMDDLAHLRDYSAEVSPGVLRTLKNDLFTYMKSGRMHPMKYVMNLVEYRYLTASPILPHTLHTIALFFSLALAGWAVLRKSGLQLERWKYLLFLVGLGIAQRPLLDIAGLCSIAEPWTALLLAWGLYLFPQHPIGYRAVLLLCSFSKEPAVTVFFASGIVHFKNLLVYKDHKLQRLLSVVFDWGMFVALALMMRHISQHGTYLASYDLWRLENSVRFGWGAAKVGFALIPAFCFVLYAMSKNQFSWKENLKKMELEWFCASFAIAYLILVTPRGVPGYLLIPPAFALWLGGCSVIVRTIPSWPQMSRKWVVVISAAFVFCASVSLTRYIRYVRGINDSTIAFNLFRMTTRPRIIVSNAMEASMTGTWLAEGEGAPVKFYSYETGRVWDPEDLFSDFDGDVVMFEFTQYFGRIPPKMMKIYEDYLGGWDMQMDQGFYKVYYSGSSKPSSVRKKAAVLR